MKTELSQQNIKRIHNLIVALESGNYAKTCTTLCAVDNDGKLSFCVEGVACDVYRKSAKNGKWVPDPFGLPEKAFGFDDVPYMRVAPEKVLRYFFNENLRLYPKNDSGWSFNRIAKYLRKKYNIND